MKSSYVVRATKFLHKIYPRISCVLNSPSRVREIIQNYNHTTGRAIYVHNGATRCVLVTSDYVIKWDYSRDVKTFGGCADEVNMYKIAKNEGYDYLLAEITPVFYKNKLFVIMPRFEKIEEEKPEIYELVNEYEYDWLCGHIGDIHDNNYTVIDDYPIIIDYACPVEKISSC